MVGAHIDKMLLNYLSDRKAQFANLFIYFFIYLQVQGKMNKMLKYDVNNYINARTQTGAIMVQFALQVFPDKVNMPLYRKILME